MRKNAKIFLLHILESIERIENFSKEASQEEFLSSEIIQDAVIRRLEIIGEAVKNLPEVLKKNIKKLNGRKSPEREIFLSTSILVWI